jgi:hypothetical protein
MMSDAIFLAKVLYPDAVEFFLVRDKVMIEVFPPEFSADMAMFKGEGSDIFRSTPSTDKYELHLEEIADGVYAGMSVWSRRVYIYEEKQA